jgi:hypothetical protein
VTGYLIKPLENSAFIITNQLSLLHIKGVSTAPIPSFLFDTGRSFFPKTPDTALIYAFKKTNRLISVDWSADRSG